MLKRILVPLDGSPRAERAIPVAARVARASGGSNILVRVVSIPLRVPWPLLSSLAGLCIFRLLHSYSKLTCLILRHVISLPSRHQRVDHCQS